MALKLSHVGNAYWQNLVTIYRWPKAWMSCLTILGLIATFVDEAVKALVGCVRQRRNASPWSNAPILGRLKIKSPAESFQVFIGLLLREFIHRIGDGIVVQKCLRELEVNRIFVTHSTPLTSSGRSLMPYLNIFKILPELLKHFTSPNLFSLFYQTRNHWDNR